MKMNNPLTYTKAKKMLGDKDRMKVANNTYLERRDESTIALRYYDTDVLTFTPTYIEINSGGYPTMSTTDRINYGPVNVGPSYNPARGWAVWLAADRPCYACEGGKLRSEYTGFSKDTLPVEYTIKKEMQKAYDARLDEAGLAEGDYFSDEYDHVYRVVYCNRCNKNGMIPSYDRESGGHPYFDGIRVNSTGRRLMREQPNKPDHFTPIFTRSGFTGRSFSRYGFANHRKVLT